MANIPDDLKQEALKAALAAKTQVVKTNLPVETSKTEAATPTNTPVQPGVTKPQPYNPAPAKVPDTPGKD